MISFLSATARNIHAFVLLCLSLFVHADPTQTIVFEPLLTYETAEHIVEIGRPGSLTFDSNGQLYILDVINRQVHIWSVDGKYVKSFGGEGEGPGEFTLDNKQGDVLVFENRLLVVDEMAAKIHLFDAESHAFLKTVPRPSYFSRLYLFDLHDKLFALNMTTSRMEQEVLALDGELNVSKVLFSREYKHFEWIDRERFYMRPFANRIIVGVGNKNIYIGESHSNLIHVYDADGQNSGSFRVPIVAREITEESKAFYRALVKKRGRQDRVTLVFGEKPIFLTSIMAMGANILILDSLPGTDHRVRGVALNERYEAIGTFDTTFGEAVILTHFKDRFFAITIGDDGGYTMTAYTVRQAAL